MTAVKTQLGPVDEARSVPFQPTTVIGATDVQEAIEAVEAIASAAAPGDAVYIVGSAHAELSAERVATDTATIDVDLGTAGQAKWNVLEVPGIASTGMVARTAAATYTARTISGTTNEITFTNGDGVSGNPTASFPTNIVLTNKNIDEVERLGINTTADSTNRLSVNSDAVLFNHNGTTSQIKVNKNATANTASHLFQVGFSGRAEFGLIASDDFLMKTSPDGSAFTTGLTILNSTAALRVHVNVSPSANDGAALGTTALQWSDLFLATGGVINYANGDYTITHSSDNLAFSGSATHAAGKTLTVGHTAPVATEIGNTSLTPTLQVLGTTAATSNGHAARYSADSSPSGFIFSKSRNASIGSHTVVQNSDSLGRIAFAGSDGTNFAQAAEIVGFVDGTPGTNDMPGGLSLRTSPDGAETPVEIMRITSAAKVVVAASGAQTGLFSEVPKLQVLGTDGPTSSMLLARYQADGSAPNVTLAKSRNASIGSHTVVQSGDVLGFITFGGSDGDQFIEGARIQAVVDGTPGDNDMPTRLVFSVTADGGSSVTEAMRISSTGAIDAGGAPSFEIPNSAAPTVDATGEIAVDTTVTDLSHGIIKYFSGEEMAVIAVPVAELTGMSNGDTLVYNSTDDEFKIQAPSGGGGLSNIVIQVFTASGTYTPTSGMTHCIIEAQAPGGGSGGADGVGRTGGAGVTVGVASGGGGGGEYRRGVFSAATIGASQSVTINAAGTAGSTAGGNGGNGGTVSVGALISANGGSGGSGTGSDSTSLTPVAGGAGGSGGSGGSFSLPGQAGGYGFIPQTNPDATAAKMKVAGAGGDSFLGKGGVGTAVSGTGDSAGVAGGDYGGGAGGATDDDTSGSAGAAGGAGIVIITEFVS